MPLSSVVQTTETAAAATPASTHASASVMKTLPSATTTAPKSLVGTASLSYPEPTYVPVISVGPDGLNFTSWVMADPIASAAVSYNMSGEDSTVLDNSTVTDDEETSHIYSKDNHYSVWASSTADNGAVEVGGAWEAPSAPLPIILSVVFGTLFVLTVFGVLVFWLRRRRHRRRERELRAARRRNHGAARAVSYGVSSLGSPLGGQAGLLDEADDEIDVDLDDPFHDRPPSIGGRDAREMSMTFLGRAGSLLMLAGRDVAGEVTAVTERRRLERSLTGTDKRALRAADLDLQHRELLDHQRDSPMEADLLGLGGADGGEILRRKMEGWAAVARQRQDEERGTMGLPPSSVVLEEKSPCSDEIAEQRPVIALPPRLRLPLHITTSLPFLPHHLPSEPPLSSTSSGTRSPYTTTTGPFSAATSTTNHSSRGLPHYYHGPRSTTSPTAGVPLLSDEYSPATATGTTLRRQATDGGHLMGVMRSIDENPHLQDDDGVGDAASLRTARSEDPPAYAWS